MEQKRNVMLLLASTLTVMAGATIAPSLPQMEQQFSAIDNAEFWVQMVMTLPGLMIAISAPLIGHFLDRGHKKMALVLSLAGFTMSGCSAFLFSDNLTALLIGRLGLGAAVAGIMVCCTTLFSDYYAGPERGKYLGIQAAYSGFGGVVFVSLASIMATNHWLQPFALYGVAILLIPGVLLWVNEPQPSPPPNIPIAQRDEQVSKSFIYACYALAALEIFSLYIVPSYMPFYVLNHPNLNSGYLIATMLLTMSCVAMSYGRWQHKLSFGHIHSLGLLIMAGGFSLWLFNMGHDLLIIAATITLGLGLGMLRPNLITWLMSKIQPQARGKTMGAITSWFFIGQFICPIISYPIAKYWGHSGLLLTVSILLVGVAIITFFISAKISNSRQATSAPCADNLSKP